MWDRLVSYYNRAGFLNGFPEDFKGAIIASTHENRSNEVYDSHGIKQAYNTTEKVFLLSGEEVGFASESSIVCGEVFDFYKNATNADRIKYDISDGTTARYWWLRVPGPGNAYDERYVYSTGAQYSRSADNGYGASPACLIGVNPE